jgi:hypothetical protein
MARLRIARKVKQADAALRAGVSPPSNVPCSSWRAGRVCKCRACKRCAWASGASCSSVGSTGIGPHRGLHPGPHPKAICKPPRQGTAGPNTAWDSSARSRCWRLSPLYDVLPRPGVAPERFLHLGVGPQGRLATLDNALASHQRFSLSMAAACRVIAEVWKVLREWRVYFDSFGVPEQQQHKVASAFRHIDDVSTAALRRMVP